MLTMDPECGRLGPKGTASLSRPALGPNATSRESSFGLGLGGLPVLGFLAPRRNY
jgi:hypothetical protein